MWPIRRSQRDVWTTCGTPGSGEAPCRAGSQPGGSGRPAPAPGRPPRAAAGRPRTGGQKLSPWLPHVAHTTQPTRRMDHMWHTRLRRGAVPSGKSAWRLRSPCSGTGSTTSSCGWPPSNGRPETEPMVATCGPYDAANATYGPHVAHPAQARRRAEREVSLEAQVALLRHRVDHLELRLAALE